MSGHFDKNFGNWLPDDGPEPTPSRSKVTYGVSFDYFNLEDSLEVWESSDEHYDNAVGLEDLINDDDVFDMIGNDGILEDFGIVEEAEKWFKENNIQLNESQQFVVSFKIDIGLDYSYTYIPPDEPGADPTYENLEINDRSIKGKPYDVEFEIIDRERDDPDMER